MRLVADIGGTNSRLGLSEAGELNATSIQSYSNSDWESLYAIISHYLSREGAARLSEVVLALAGPVNSNRAELTNRDWVVDSSHLKDVFGVDRVLLLNDLTALGYSVPRLKPSDLFRVNIGTSNPLAVSQSLVVGIGTGFNVSPVLESEGKVICPAVEVGHICLPRQVIERLQDLGFGQAQFSTIESLFSGRGFSAFCAEFTSSEILSGPALCAAYGTPEKSGVTAAIEQYSGLLGCLLRDLSLAYLPSSGIYLAGSVARSVMKTAPMACLEILLQPFQIPVVKDAPIWIIESDGAALIGCAEFEFG